MTRPTILLTGANGQVGFELQRTLAPHGYIVACDRDRLDLGDRDALVNAVRSIRPQLVVNTAAYTAVDRAESELPEAEAINTTAPAILAEEAKRVDAVMVHFSTDYVFDGASTVPYDEQAPTRPLNVYGRTKRDGENAIAAIGGAHVIFRTGWVYGFHGNNFLLTMLRLAAEREELRVVADQFGVPNWSRDLAETIAMLVGRGVPALVDRAGLYHVSASGVTNWFEFARAIIGDVERPRVVPITTAEYPTPAKRPAYGVLATGKFEQTFGIALPAWRDALSRCLAAGNESFEHA